MARIKTYRKSKSKVQYQTVSQQDLPNREETNRNGLFSVTQAHLNQQTEHLKHTRYQIERQSQKSIQNNHNGIQPEVKNGKGVYSIEHSKNTAESRISQRIKKRKVRIDDGINIGCQKEDEKITAKSGFAGRTSRRLKTLLKEQLPNPSSDDSEENVSASKNDFVESRFNNIPKLSQSLIINLEELLLYLFTSKECDIEVSYLEEYEFFILKSIIQRRTKNQISLSQCLSTEQVACYFHKSLKKRCEEVYRFVLENAFKFLKSKFFEKLHADNPKKKVLKRSNDNKLFYAHYFADLAKQKEIDISRFCLPFENSRNKFYPRKRGKTNISIGYITLIFESKLFRDDFMAYLDRNMRQDCIRATRHRIEVYIKKWKEVLNLEYYYSRVIDTICEELQSEKKYFLPWTHKEIDSAIEEMRRTLIKYRLIS